MKEFNMERDAERQDSIVDAVGDMIETYRDLMTARIVEHHFSGSIDKYHRYYCDSS
jgi:hypothetical protein